ncbi:hypothetical protein [Xanthobacter tagetidis]|uniref:DUF551 domain-containing protein n=1 Tax=Xanthobacter tagetidis TaxID=60216 RepID=A0A3L7AH94_9HYPH|nr:hypothetical protein [Xanthobacter tagetidis]MBB6306283.1 hypothetical protein [Xanthobacter tagetidis]RLP79557.1 hypothetical protein D9R14_07795 [Xanthobacter tagetidis]
MANDLITELDRLHHRATDMRARERQLADAGENDPASDAWKTAAILAASAESEFESALVEAWPALAALLREAGGWNFDMDAAPKNKLILLGGMRDGPPVDAGSWGCTKYNRSKREFDLGWTTCPGHERFPTCWRPLPAPPAAGGKDD